MGEEIAFENGRISDFQGLVTLTLTLDQVILHIIMHHSSTSTYIPNFIEIEGTFCGRMDRRADGHLRPTLLGRLGGVDLIRSILQIYVRGARSRGQALGPGGIMIRPCVTHQGAAYDAASVHFSLSIRPTRPDIVVTYITL